ncbi:hypothetical protein NP233_g3355 [Leucocoprinus birnbaumii]|uniref:Uncharacterized protein n=1 Tax=Leucocoprinus birnbaumii TaxID=56174 RepID=A0AAD5VWM6_9AGAR|nr:hypothetical protein NP233_g3355 [Leucocoprinus birnbaumii]
MLAFFKRWSHRTDVQDSANTKPASHGDPRLKSRRNSQSPRENENSQGLCSSAPPALPRCQSLPHASSVGGSKSVGGKDSRPPSLSPFQEIQEAEIVPDIAQAVSSGAPLIPPSPIPAQMPAGPKKDDESIARNSQSLASIWEGIPHPCATAIEVIEGQTVDQEVHSSCPSSSTDELPPSDNSTADSQTHEDEAGFNLTCSWLSLSPARSSAGAHSPPDDSVATGNGQTHEEEAAYIRSTRSSPSSTGNSAMCLPSSSSHSSVLFITAPKHRCGYCEEECCAWDFPDIPPILDSSVGFPSSYTPSLLRKTYDQLIALMEKLDKQVWTLKNRWDPVNQVLGLDPRHVYFNTEPERPARDNKELVVLVHQEVVIELGNGPISEWANSTVIAA